MRRLSLQEYYDRFRPPGPIHRAILGLVAKLPDGVIDIYERDDGELAYRVAGHMFHTLPELAREHETPAREGTVSAENRCSELQEYEAASEAAGLKFMEHLGECQRCLEWFTAQEEQWCGGQDGAR